MVFGSSGEITTSNWSPPGGPRGSQITFVAETGKAIEAVKMATKNVRDNENPRIAFFLFANIGVISNGFSMGF